MVNHQPHVQPWIGIPDGNCPAKGARKDDKRFNGWSPWLKALGARRIFCPNSCGGHPHWINIS